MNEAETIRKSGAIYECGFCGHVSKTLKDAMNHREDCKPDYTCGKCGKMFSTTEALHAHEMSC